MSDEKRMVIVGWENFQLDEYSLGASRTHQGQAQGRVCETQHTCTHTHTHFPISSALTGRQAGSCLKAQREWNHPLRGKFVPTTDLYESANNTRI